MSDSEDLNIREQIARIDRSIIENAKFQAKTEKLRAEAQKFHRDRSVALVTAGAGLALASAAVSGVALKVLGY